MKSLQIVLLFALVCILGSVSSAEVCRGEMTEGQKEFAMVMANKLMVQAQNDKALSKGNYKRINNNNNVINNNLL